MFLGVSLGWDRVKTPRRKSPRQVAHEIEAAAEEIERLQREAIERMRRQR